MAESNTDHTKPAHVVGRYAVYGRLAAGGMATVHLGRLVDPQVPPRTVAIKRLHPQFCKDPEFVAMFIDEARLAARIKHPNVVETLDILTMGQELLLVMEYIRGECFSKLLRAGRRKNLHPAIGVVGAIASGMLHGLHAAHEAKDDAGNLLNVVHRDISPQNVMIGVDGVAKVLDFGVAKASARIQITRDGQMKGKLSYMSPEQLQGLPVDRRADVFACGVVLWEALTRQRLFVGEDATEVLKKILKEEVAKPSSIVPGLSPEVDALVLRALHKDPQQRYQTAQELALDVERYIALAAPAEVGGWMESVAGEILGKRARLLGDIEGTALPTGDVPNRQSNPEAFAQLSSWAEREAARVAASGDRPQASATRLVGSGLADHSEDSLAGHPLANHPLVDDIEEDGRTIADALCVTDPDDEEDMQSAVTVAAEPSFNVDGFRGPGQVASPYAARALPPITAPPMIAPLTQSSRGTRWGVILAIAAGVVGVAALLAVQLRDGSSAASSHAMSLRPKRVQKTVAEVRREQPHPKATEVQADPMPAQSVDDLMDVADEVVAQVTEQVKEEEKPVAAKRAARPVAAAPPRAARESEPEPPRQPKARPRRREVPVVHNVTKRKDEVDCSKPYWIDERGIKRLKLACL